MPSIGPLQPNPFDAFQVAETSLKPLWTVNFEDEEDILKWCRQTVDFCEDYYRIHFNIQLDNMLIDKGVQWLNQSRTSNRFLDKQGVVTRKSPRVVLNHSHDLVESKVSRNTRYRPKVAFYPANQEQSDRDDAKTAQDVNDYIWYVNTIEKVIGKWLRQIFICGEGFLFCEFNPNKGDLHPDYVKAKQEGRSVPVLDSEGNPVLKDDGTPLLIERAVRVGEVDYRVVPPWHVFENPSKDRDGVDWCIEWDCVDVDYLKAKYPDKADDIKPDSGMEVFSNYRLDVNKFRNEVVVYKLYHRHHEFLDTGRYIYFTKECILENTKHPYSHGELPYIYLEDIEQPDVHRGMSFLQQIFPIQHQINACASLIYKALVLFAHPKIVYEAGSVQMSQLIAESTLLAVDPGDGMVPTVLNNPIVPQELFQYLNKLEETIEKLSATYSLSRGVAPSGVRAAKALRVLEEQEDKRNYYFGVKYQEALVRLAKMTVSTAGDYYQDSDGRLLRVVGANQEYKIRQFRAKNLGKPYFVRCENTTALSKSASGRIEDINEIAQVKLDDKSPISQGQYLELSGLADLKEFEDVQTRAFKCASSENEDFRAGRPVSDPTPDEDFFTHWKTHIQETQSREWKELVAPDRKAKHQEHVKITEFLMWTKAYGIQSPMMPGVFIQAPNLAFQQKLMLLENFPVYFSPPANGGMPLGMGGGMPGMMPPPQVGSGETLQPDPLMSAAAPVSPGPLIG